MPWTAFFANGLWVLVIGLMGPSVPFIIEEFSLDYQQAGLIFTILSISSFIGTFIGGWVSDYRRRKIFWLAFLILLAAGLAAYGTAASFFMLLVTVFFMSLFGSPIGAIGQSIMLQIFPAKRGRYLSLSTMFAAAGSFIAPLMISLVYLAGLNWRAAFYLTSIMVIGLFFLVLLSKLPQPTIGKHSSLSVFRLFIDKRIMFTGIMIFFGVGFDLGFSFWLAEYFITYAGTAAEISGFAVGCYLAGVITGRYINSRKPEHISGWLLPAAGIGLAVVSLLLFLNISIIPLKLLFCILYGLGIAPVFPSMMAHGTAYYPERSGAVTAVLFSIMSLSGAVFPVVIGIIGRSLGIEQAYYTLLLMMIPVVIGMLVRKRFS
ncbi:MAG TPA: hypothetical protein DCO79_14715 [Spirochaeta sp.]|nr:hypothetical protein [Spirochaeta sp.]